MANWPVQPNGDGEVDPDTGLVRMGNSWVPSGVYQRVLQGMSSQAADEANARQGLNPEALNRHIGLQTARDQRAADALRQRGIAGTRTPAPGTMRLSSMEQGTPLGDYQQGDPAVENGGIPTGEGWGTTGPSMDTQDYGDTSGNDYMATDNGGDQPQTETPAPLGDGGDARPPKGWEARTGTDGQPYWVKTDFNGKEVWHNPATGWTSDGSQPPEGIPPIGSSKPAPGGGRLIATGDPADPHYTYEPDVKPSGAPNISITTNATPGQSDLNYSHAGYFDAAAQDRLSKAQSGLYDAQAEYQRAQAGKDQAAIQQAKDNLAEQQRQFDLTRKAADQAQTFSQAQDTRNFENQEAWRRENTTNQQKQLDIDNKLKDAQLAEQRGEFGQAQALRQQAQDQQNEIQKGQLGVSQQGANTNAAAQQANAAYQTGQLGLGTRAADLAAAQFKYQQDQNPFSFVQRAQQARGLPMDNGGVPAAGAPVTPAPANPVRDEAMVGQPTRIASVGQAQPLGSEQTTRIGGYSTAPPVASASSGQGMTETPTRIGGYGATPAPTAQGDTVRRTMATSTPVPGAPLSAKDIVDQTPGLSMVYSGKTPGAFHSGLALTSAQSEAKLLPEERAARDSILRATGSDPAAYHEQSQQLTANARPARRTVTAAPMARYAA